MRGAAKKKYWHSNLLQIVATRKMGVQMIAPETLTQELGGKWHGSYGTAPCPVCQTERRKDQNALTVSRGRSGLVLHCKKLGCNFAEILENAGAMPEPVSPSTVYRSHQSGSENGERARVIWNDAIGVSNTRACAYLNSRGITCPLPETLRFMPDCRHPSGVILPAMLGLIEGSKGFAVHRTYLDRYQIGKAKVQPCKAMLGAASGGAVRLSHGAGPLVVAEGIETALSLLCGLLAKPARVWAALSTSGMRGLSLAPDPGELIIAADGDAPGQAAAFDLASRASALGWAVSQLVPPNGLDWNDVLLGKAGAA